MDFNDIQNTWNSDKAEKISLPDNLEKIQSANTPLDKIRKNLKKEFYMQIFSIILIAATPAIHGFPNEAIKPFYLFYSAFVAVCIYYLTKLYLFYKRLNLITLKTKDSLYETYFDIRLNMELYKTFGFALTPFIVLFLIAIFYSELKDKFNLELSNISNSIYISLFLIITLSILFMGLALEWWVKHYYGKYAEEIKRVIAELKEE